MVVTTDNTDAAATNDTTADDTAPDVIATTVPTISVAAPVADDVNTTAGFTAVTTC